MSGRSGVFGRKSPAPGLRAWTAVREALVSLNDQGLIAYLAIRGAGLALRILERPIRCPGTARFRIGQTGMLIAAERSVSPEAVKACRDFVLGQVSSSTCILFGVMLADCVGTWRRKVSAARGLWSSPNGPGVACRPSTPSGYNGVSEKKQCSGL